MSYLGRGLDKISNIEILDNITFDGSSSYSITKNSVPFTPNSAQSLLISIDGVVNATNFTVNGSTIDFGVAVPSTSVCNFFLHYGTGVMTVPSDGSVTTAKLGDSAVTTAKITDANVTSAKMFSGFKNGITMTDSWRLTAHTNTSTAADITTNWEKNDTTGHTNIGTGLTESSGIFSFPQTGFYYIDYSFTIGANTDASAEINLNVTFDNSSYASFSEAFCGSPITATGFANQTCSNTNFINVTNISNVKFKFSTISFATGTQILGNALDEQRSGFSIIRLGDSQ